MAHHDLWTLDALIGAYRQHQRRTRGLRERTLHGYERLVRPFVHAALGDDPIDPTCLGPAWSLHRNAQHRMWRTSPVPITNACE